MSLSERNFDRTSAKFWFCHVKNVELTHKTAILHINGNLYHYAGNNPVKYTDPDGKYSWEQFKRDITPAVNCDFGFDYSQYAANAWANKNYFTAALYELDATCEMAYDLLACYGGAKAVGELPNVISSVKTAISMLSGTIASLSKDSTVVLGKYSSGSCGGYTKMADKLGANCFQLPNKVYNVLEKAGLGSKINEKWLDGVIDSGARILLNSDPTKVTPNDASAYGMEINRLRDAGYEFVQTVEKGIECWEVTK